MGLLEKLLRPEKLAVQELDEEIGELACVDCAIVMPPFLYEMQGLLYCVECVEARLRREREKNEDGDWDLNTK